ncbi:MAG: SWIM zinc finger family protein [Planctomycetaceae bacterium]|jgi:hypothetical protein|nr:SWIM zinc finger family protein [Planctomycetaceae bacterium]
MNLTSDQIKALSPDSASFASGQSLSLSGQWKNCGQSADAIWGECQGSGKSPYQIRIDQREFAYRCSCPSRKLPCKHVLGLLLLSVNNSASVPQSDEPDWITQWLADRDGRAQKKSEKIATDGTPKKVDEKAQLKRIAERRSRVDAGIGQFENWLCDLVRVGIADLDRKPLAFWDDQSKRLIDSQAPGLAAKIQHISELVGIGEGWHERILGELGRLALLIKAYRKLDQLDKNLQDEIRQQIGWTVDQKALAESGEKIYDQWLLLGQSYELNTKIQTQRNWYYGIQSGRFLLYLQFAAGKNAATTNITGFAETHVSGSIVDAEVVFWTGTDRLRGKFLDRKTIILPEQQKNQTENKHNEKYTNGFFVTKNNTATITNFLDDQAERFATQIWSEIFPMWLDGVAVYPPKISQDNWTISDGRYILPLVSGEHWQLLAISCGNPVRIFGEWDGYKLKPLSVHTQNKFYPIH